RQIPAAHRWWASRILADAVRDGGMTGQTSRRRPILAGREVRMQGRVAVSLRIPGTSPMPELMRLIQDVEAAGFDGAGILDSQLLCRDTFVTLGQAATQTSRLTLFPAVTNPFSRHVSVLGGAIQTVAELAPGRTKVVIGTGYTSA